MTVFQTDPNGMLILQAQKSIQMTCTRNTVEELQTSLRDNQIDRIKDPKQMLIIDEY